MALMAKSTLQKKKEKAQQVFNAYIRQRDKGKPCISCGRHVEEYDAGHYVPVKGGSFLRFHEWNAHAECRFCNRYDEFHLIGYRRNLVERIGEEAVRWLEENRHTIKKWSNEELEEIINRYKPVRSTLSGLLNTKDRL